MAEPTVSGGEPRGVLVMLEADGRSGDRRPSELFQVVMSYWRLIAGVSLVFALAALAYCLLAPKWYRAQTVVVPVSQEGSASVLGSLQSQLGGLAALAGLDMEDGEQFKREALARFGSRAFTYDFIKREGLLPILFAEKWDADARRWRDEDSVPTLEDAFKRFQEQVRTISEDRRNGLVKVTVDWKNPKLAMEWANRLVSSINADLRASARVHVSRNLEYLEKELAKTDAVELRQAVNRLIEAEVRKAMLASVREEYAFKVVDPAFLPTRKNVVRPRLVVVTATATMAGALLAFVIACILHLRRRAAAA